MMTAASEMERLRARMIETQGTYGGMTHPDVVAVSQQLDELIMDFYRNRQAGGRSSARGGGWK
jgi:hypothetical protein